MRNRKAEGTVWGCVITVFCCMMLALFLTFFEALESAKTSKREAKTVLDAMVTENAVIEFDSLRDSHSSTEEIAGDAYTERLTDFAELNRNGDSYIKEKNGREIYRISSPVLVANADTLTVTYTLSVPIYFAGQKLAPAVFPVTVEAKYKDKIE